MCVISLETSTRRIEVGDMAVIGMVHNFHGAEVKAAVPMIKREDEDIVCLCIKEGDELTLGKLPGRFVHDHHLVRTEARVTFREGVRHPYSPRPDRVEFDNGEIVNFVSLPLRVELTCDARGDQPKPKVVERTAAARTVSNLFVAARSIPRTSVGVAVLTVLLMIGYTLL